MNYVRDSVISWTSSGKTLLHPYDLSDRTWRNTILSHSPDSSYLIPGFNINTENSYVGLIHSVGIPYHKVAEKRFDRELQVIGQQICWSNSIQATKDTEDQLVLIQLSRFGDIYCESFDFEITSSPMYKAAEIWFDPESHREQILRRTETEEIIPQKRFFTYDAVPFLYDILFFLFNLKYFIFKFLFSLIVNYI